MITRNLIKPNRYQDSVTLCRSPSASAPATASPPRP